LKPIDGYFSAPGSWHTLSHDDYRIATEVPAVKFCAYFPTSDLIDSTNYKELCCPAVDRWMPAFFVRATLQYDINCECQLNYMFICHLLLNYPTSISCLLYILAN